MAARKGCAIMTEVLGKAIGVGENVDVQVFRLERPVDVDPSAEVRLQNVFVADIVDDTLEFE